MPSKPGDRYALKRHKDKERQYNASRPARHGFYASPEWRRLRDWYRGRHPLCEECQRQGRVTAAELVHHKREISKCGEPTQPLITIAAGPDLPFGTWVWLEGFGWRRVDDRGSRIKPGHVDICFPTRAEALEWGRREILMVVPGWNNEQK